MTTLWVSPVGGGQSCCQLKSAVLSVEVLAAVDEPDGTGRVVVVETAPSDWEQELADLADAGEVNIKEVEVMVGGQTTRRRDVTIADDSLVLAIEVSQRFTGPLSRLASQVINTAFDHGRIARTPGSGDGLGDRQKAGERRCDGDRPFPVMVRTSSRPNRLEVTFVPEERGLASVTLKRPLSEWRSRLLAPPAHAGQE